MPSLNSKHAAAEALRARARASLSRDAASAPASAAVVTAPVPSSAPSRRQAAYPTQKPDGSWTLRGVSYARGHDAWAAFQNGPAPTPASKPSPSRRPWREWLIVTRADGRPWDTPTPNLSNLPQWMRKIAAEVAEEIGVAPDEAALFVDVNTDLIRERFLASVARVDVVAELMERN